MSRLALVRNPVKVEDADALADLVAQRCTDLGWDPPLVLDTTADDPGTGQAKAALDAGVDVVVVAGGDGTVRAVADGLAGTATAMAVVPAGTGNLLARNLGLPLDTQEAVEVSLTGRDRRLDLGVVHDGPQRHAFAVMAGLGFDAAMMREAPEALKGRLGWPAYVVGAARGLRRSRLSVEVVLDDRPALRRQVRTVLVGNVGALQGGVEIMPDARPDDGLLDVTLVAPRGAADWVWLAARLLRRRHPSRRDRRLERFQARHVVVRARGVQPRQMDGDLVEDGTGLDVSILPGALTVRLPAERLPAERAERGPA